MGMSRSQIEEELKNLLLKIIDVEPEDIKPQAHFFKDLGVDSIKAIEITVAIEKHFKISFRDEQVAEITTLGEAVKVVESILKEKSY